MFLKRWFTQATNHPFDVGTCVVIKTGVKEADTGLDMSGWQGRISEVDEESDLITVDWDSITLRALPPAYIEMSEENGYGWDQYLLPPSEVEVTTARDTEEEVETTVAELTQLYAWVALGPEGKEIQAVLQNVDWTDTVVALETWVKHLRKVLTFPFKAVVAEFQDYGRLQAGDKVVVRRIAEVDERYGVLVEIQSQHGIALFPLCDLEAANGKSPNHQQVHIYAVWYANR